MRGAIWLFMRTMGPHSVRRLSKHYDSGSNRLVDAIAPDTVKSLTKLPIATRKLFDAVDQVDSMMIEQVFKRPDVKTGKKAHIVCAFGGCADGPSATQDCSRTSNSIRS